jgi:hypothetical protein
MSSSLQSVMWKDAIERVVTVTASASAPSGYEPNLRAKQQQTIGFEVRNVKQAHSNRVGWLHTRTTVCT